MIKAFIFDMDGVIIDSEPDHIEFEQEIFKKLGLDISREEHMSFIGSTSHYMWDTLRVKYKLPYTLEQLVEQDRDTYYKHLISSPSAVKSIDGVIDFIKKLRAEGFKLAVASSSPLEVIETVINILNVSSYFDVIVTGDYVSRSKPAPDIFLYASEKLKVTSNMCVVVEDSHNGVCAAKHAGMKCIGFRNPNSGNQDLSKADMIIDSFEKVDYKRW